MNFDPILAVAVIAVLFWLVMRPQFALTANAVVNRFADIQTTVYGVLAGQYIYRGSLVGLTPSGYLKVFEPGDRFVGVAYEECDASSDTTDGTSTCEVYTDGDFEFTLSGAAVTDVGKPAFATADDTLALTGHPDAFVGYIVNYLSSNTVRFRLKAFGEKPPNGVGSHEFVETGGGEFETTGAASASKYIRNFIAKSILGLGVSQIDAEDGGIGMSFDAVAEIALGSLRMSNEIFPVDKGITFEAKLCVTDKGDDAALDIDFGLGTALTTNSEADIDHADMAQLACFHMNGNSDNILAQSDDATTDVAPVDTTIDNDSTTDVAKKFKIIVRPDGEVEFWINNARVLSSTAFAVLSTADLAPFVNMEKTSNDTTAVLKLYYLRVAGGKAA